jgi:hypothetical protein
MTETWAFMFIIAIVMIVFDIYIIKKKGKSASISASVIRVVNANRLVFFLIFSLGVVCGHLFWAMPTESIYNDVKCEKVTE